MKAHIGCIPCFLRQSLEAADMSTDDEAIREKALREILRYLLREDWNKSTPEIGTAVHRIVKKITGNRDPYEKLKEKYPDICIELGMAGEFILGMHSELEYDGVRLAGLYPHDQVKLAQKAGVTIFGPVVKTNTSESCPWNLSRAITFMKACSAAATIPIHVNMGMGVGSVTVNDHPPIDIVSRASKAMVEICRLDGL